MNDAFCVLSEYLVEVIFLSLLVGDYKNVFYEEPTWNRNFIFKINATGTGNK